MYGDVRGGSRYGDIVGCQWLLPPLSVTVYAKFLNETDVFRHER